MRRIYTFFLYLLVPMIVLRLVWKGRRLAAYRQRMRERFALISKKKQPVDIWVHAVSLGEAVAITPLVEALLGKSLRVLITTMTPTGSQHVIKRFADKVQHQYVPYDLPWVVRRFFAKYTPKLGIIMETELWPNLINQAKKRYMPLLLANARLSDRAFGQYHRLRFVFKPVLNQFNAILAQSQSDADRFIALGAAPAIVEAFGNMKFDLQIQAKPNEFCRLLKEQWGDKRTVVMIASTHDNEESQILKQLSKLKQAIPDLVLLIAPRHPERFSIVYQLCVDSGYCVAKRSEAHTVNSQVDIVVVDTLGELLSFYQVSDYAFVGGSLVPIGGHNVLEPIAMQVPVFCGPYMQNSKAICQELEASQAIIKVQQAEQLIDAIIKVHQNKQDKEQLIANASSVLAANQGTMTRYLEKIGKYSVPLEGEGVCGSSS